MKKSQRLLLENISKNDLVKETNSLKMRVENLEIALSKLSGRVGNLELSKLFAAFERDKEENLKNPPVAKNTIFTTPDNNECKYCSEVRNENEVEEKKYDENYSGLVIDKNKVISIWDSCEDECYSGLAVPDIKYCPYCGKQILAF